VRQLERRADTIGRLVDRIGYRPAKDLDERFHDAAPDPVRVRTGLCGNATRLWTAPDPNSFQMPAIDL
jgi:hypothetical protein